METKVYLRNDGNGGLNISKNLVIALTLVLALATTITSVVSYGKGIESRVGLLEDDLTELNYDLSIVFPMVTENKKDIEVIYSRIEEHFKSIDYRLSKIEGLLP